jgi:hypothetical protein
MGQLAALNLFVIHAFKHGNEDDKKFARYILKNELKGILIANAFVFFYTSYVELCRFSCSVISPLNLMS